MTTVTTVTPAATHPLSLSPQKQALLLMVLFGVLWALLENAVIVRLRVAYDLTEIVWCRYAAHLLLVWAVWGVRHPGRLWRTDQLGVQLGRSVLMLIMPVSFALSVAHGVAPETTLALFWTSPLLIVALAHWILKEGVSRRVWALTALAVGGAALVLGPHALHSVRSLFWPAAMAGSFSLYVVLTRALRHETLSANLFYTGLGVFLPLSVYVPRVWITPSLHDAAILFGVGAVGLVALLTLDRAVERADVSSTSGAMTTQVFGALHLARARPLVFPLPMAALGLIAILGSVALSWFVEAPVPPLGPDTDFRL